MNLAHSVTTSLSAQTGVAAYIGIDWSDRKHDICIYDVASQTQKSLQLEPIYPERVRIWLLDY